MNIENPMENIKKIKPKEELIIETFDRSVDPIKKPLTPKEIHEHKMNYFNEQPEISLEKEKTTKEKFKEAVQEIPPVIQVTAEQKIKVIENKDNGFLKQSNEDHERMEREARLEKQGDLLDIERQIGIVEEAIKKNEDSYIVEDAKKRLPILKKKYNELLEQVLEDTKKSLNKK